MEQSPRLSLSYVLPAQAQKHVTVNETFRRLDALVQLAVISQSVTTEPAGPAEGDGYILPAGASGAAWSAMSTGDVAVFQDGAWARIASVPGLRAWVEDEAALAIYDGSVWTFMTGGAAAETAAKFGVNAVADATNRLAVKSDAVLFSHDDVTPGNDDCIIKVNKAAPGDTASHIFQTAFSGRAEFGLTGDDDFHVKVSPNGSWWSDAILVDKDNGRVAINGSFSPDTPLHVRGSGDVATFEDALGGTTNFIILGTAQSGAIGRFQFRAHNDSLADTNYGAFVCKADDDTAGSEYGSVEIRPIINGNGSNSNYYLSVGDGVTIGNPTGGGKGSGSLNATAVYDDNTLLSCYVFDQALDGAIDHAKWDGKVPDRRGQDGAVEVRSHEPMRRFAALTGGDYDPLTLDGYARHWRERRHLPAMPDEATFDPVKGLPAGEWIQRLLETVETQAVLIDQLHQRISVLEVKPQSRA